MTARALTARPAAGSAAHNQYGTFSVSYATEKQTNYIHSILSRKDLSSLAPGVAAQLWDQCEHNQINKTAASAIIDMLLALPDSTTSTNSLGAPATDKQKQFVRTLLAEREGNEAAEALRYMLNSARERNELTAKLMSATIEQLIAIRPNDVPVVVPDGRYALPAEDGHFVFYKVEAGQGKWDGYTFVVQLIGSVGDWQEARLSQGHSKSVLARIAANVEEAARMFGIKAKACGYCASPLSNIQSRAAGYGEICAHNHGFYYSSHEEAVQILAERGEND